MGQDAIVYRHDRRHGDDTLIVEMHRRGYASEGPRFGEAFCRFVGETVAEAKLGQSPRSRVWFAERDGAAIGCAALVDRGEIGQLRWLVLLPEARGHGVGRALVDRVLAHARACNHRSIFLETTDGLDASMGIYEKLGFQVSDSHVEQLWHGPGIHITMALPL